MTDFLDELMQEIKSKHRDTIQYYELNEYASRYRNYYDENVKPNPKKGFFACWSWDAEQSKNFHKKFKKLKLKVIEYQPEPLHSYILEKNGMARLNELEEKIKR